MTKRARVLLIAYACRPGESSEREVGWRWANLIQQNHDVTVLTRETHRSHIEAEISSRKGHEPVPEFLYYDLPAWASWYKRGERGLYLYYALWTLFAVAKARRMNENGRWQITHFLTFGTLIWPQFAFCMNTAYVLGPVGGGERIPLSLRTSFSWRMQLKIVLRRLTQKLLFINPVYRANLRRADKIFARTRETLEMIPVGCRAKAELLLETAISPSLIEEEPPLREGASLEIVSVGRLISSKFNPLMLEALAQFKAKWSRPFRMTIIGDGPERAGLEALRDRLGLIEVDFVGKKSSKDVMAALRRSDVYFSTTMKEGGTWAFFEAIACHLPIVCLKVNGPDMIVGDGCGIKVSPNGHAQACAALADALVALASDPPLRRQYALRAHDYVRNTYTWERVSQRVDAAYAEILRNKAGAA